MELVIRVWPWVVAGAFLPGALAQTCPEPEDSFGHPMSNQTQVDYYSHNCRTIEGTIYLNPGFTENFILPNVTNIPGFIELSNSDSVKSIEFPDLEHLGALNIGEIGDGEFQQLNRISMPKLQSVEELRIDLFGAETTIELPALQNVSLLTMTGNWTSVSLDSLKTVHKDLEIKNSDNHTPHDGKKAMDISLPGLEEVKGNFQVLGKIASFSVPNLERMATVPPNDGFQFAHRGSPVSVSFPKLTTGARITVDGDVSQLEIGPVSQNAITDITVFPSIPISVSALGENIDLYISGPIESLGFPKVKIVSGIYIYSPNPFDCGAFKKELEQTTGGGVNNFSCDAPGMPGGLSAGAKAGIGVGVSVAGIALIAAAFFLWKRKGKKSNTGVLGSDEGYASFLELNAQKKPSDNSD